MDPLLYRLIPNELESMQQRAHERSQCAEVIRLGSKYIRVGRLEMIIGGHRKTDAKWGRIPIEWEVDSLPPFEIANNTAKLGAIMPLEPFARARSEALGVRHLLDAVRH
jgi:hypothetical protein